MKTICSWRKQLKKRPNLKKVEELTNRAAELAGVTGDPVISLVFLPEDRMAEVNYEVLSHQGPTDVISFDLRQPGFFSDGETPEIELYVCPGVAAREAEKRELPYAREVALYIVHGLLHIAGEDDLEPAKKRRMRRAEKRVLTKLEQQFEFERIFK